MSRRRTSDTLPFDTLRLEGSLFVPELLERAARGGATAQKETDYDIPKGLKLHDEYGRAFRIAGALWQDFAAQRPRADLNATTFTRRFVIDFLRQTLGYDDLAALSEPVVIGDRGFPVTAQALGGRLPVIIAPHHLGLDDPDPAFAIQGSGAKKKSAHQLAQEYLNATPAALWAIVSNGRSLRLLRDAETLTRPNFLEFDLETILGEGEDRYTDFSALWRLLHASRSGDRHAPSSSPADCIWEQWKGEGHAQGLRVRDGLRNGVQEALLILGTGFLAHPDNDTLRRRFQDGSLNKEAYFQQLLRLVYRFLFLFCAEERDLIHAPDANPNACDLYARGYSLRRLRTRALRRSAQDRHGDLWVSIQIVHSALATGQEKLALPALGGLFAVDQCPDLDAALLPNRDLLGAMRQLRWSDLSGRLAAIDYRNMGPEELGSVYESLLELIPTVDLPARAFGFVGITDEGSASGNERKTTGSYYTPDSLVQELIKSALDPVIAQKIADHPDNPVDALLSLSVIDPACGSGHFLISAARRLAEKLAELRAPDGAVRPDDYRHALREVISRCIYGVDRNPMALELARTALWLEGYEPGQPLSFLDHHLQCGDALLGLTSFDQLRKGIAKDAFTVLSGDCKEVCKTLAATNREALKALEKRLKDKNAELFDATDLYDALQRLEAIEVMPDDSTGEVEKKKAAFARFLADAQDSPLAHACDLLVAAYLTPKSPQHQAVCPTTVTLLDVLFPQQGQPAPQAVIDHATELCREARVFHWPLRFAHIFGHGGFDCVLGNPPWERIKLQEQEFFAAREPAIAAAKNKAERAKRIQWLSEGSLHYHLSQFESSPPPDRNEVALFREFENEKRLAEATSAFAHVNGTDGGRFPLTGVGDVNTYALFAETIEQIRADSGRAGFIVPTGIATDDSTKAFFSSLADNNRLVALWSFENEEFVFTGVHHAFKFCLVVSAGEPTGSAADLAFFLRQVSWLQDEGRRFALSVEDFWLINPNTRTCPVFRSEADAELTKKIYRRFRILVEEARVDAPEKNPWGITFSTMFHMSNESEIFVDELETNMLPLYEAKMMHQFDHRWAHFGNRKRNKSGDLVTEDSTTEEKANPHYHITPRYWVPERAVLAKIARAPKCVRDAFRDQDFDDLLAALAIWIEARHEPDLLSGMTTSTARERVLQLVGQKFDDLPTKEEDWLNDKKLTEARDWPPLSEEELEIIRNASDLTAATHQILDDRSPRWLMGWRDITNATNERTVIASVLPRAAVGHTLPLFSSPESPALLAATLANWSSLVLDFIARQKIGGTHLTYGYLKQLPILPPSAYSESDLAFIVPRVLELTYTADDMSGWAQDLGHNGAPFRFDPDRRALLRAELDAWYARLYGLTREELQYILDPATTHGPDYPSVTFPGLKKNEIAKYGEYRTHRLVLEAWDRLAATDDDSIPNSGSRKHEKGDLSIPKMNPFFERLPVAFKHLESPREGTTFYARVDQAEYEVPSKEGVNRTFIRLEAFYQPWFNDYMGSRFVDPGDGEESFVRFYAEAPLAVLELEINSVHTKRFPSLVTLLGAAESDIEPDEWFRIRAGGPRGNLPISETVPLTVYSQLYGEGIPLTLDRIEPVDEETKGALEAAVEPRHIKDTSSEEIEPLLSSVGHSLEWAVVYDVGQGNAIGLCDPGGLVRLYFDLGGGTGANTYTFPSALNNFCFTQHPPIILSHWDSDHWFSANRDPQALRSEWIAPRQKFGPTQAAMIANIQRAGGRVRLLPNNFSASRYGQIHLELANGSGRNHSGIVLTLTEYSDGTGQQILMPGDADYQHIGSFVSSGSGSPYLSVVASHHGGRLKAKTSIPGNPGGPISRLVYSAGLNNTYGHPLPATRQAHSASPGWRDPVVSPSTPHDVRETSHRGPSGLGHVFLGWQAPAILPMVPCGGGNCQLDAQQS